MKNRKEKIKELKSSKDISTRHNLAVIAKASTSGITLIALVVTIIVLIILAGISINLVLGENGIITKAQEARKAQEIAEIKEEIQLEIMEKQADNSGNMTEDELKTILEAKGILTSEENILERTLITTEGGHEIKVSDI